MIPSKTQLQIFYSFLIINFDFRSLSGEGNFNWRFIFPFDYIKAEDRITYPIKGTFDIEPHMIKANCELTLQVWDADIITRDNFIGKLFHNGFNFICIRSSFVMIKVYW